MRFLSIKAGALAVLTALLLSGCDRLGWPKGMALVSVEPNGRDCSINQTRMSCADVAAFLLREDRLSALSRIEVQSNRGDITEAMAERVANNLKDAEFYRVQVGIASVSVRVDRGAAQCSVERVAMPCSNVVTHLRDSLHTPLADPVMVSPDSGEFSSDSTRLVAERLGEAGYVNVLMVGVMEWAGPK